MGAHFDHAGLVKAIDSIMEDVYKIVKEKAKQSFSFVSVSKKAKGYISVSKAGKVTVKKGLKKGTYNLRVKVTAKKTANYKTTSVTRKIKITVQ